VGMKFTKEMIAEDEKRWHSRDIKVELGYCSNYMRDRKDMTNLDIRFYAYIMRKALELLKAQESIANEPHGQWVKVYGYATPGGDPVWRCSECGKGIHTYGIEHGTYGANIADGQWVSCPNCGVKIDGEKW